MRGETSLALHDFEPEKKRFLQEVLSGLHRQPKELPCKYFYDERGSRLFERICDLPEYYPTRTEVAIMQTNVQEMAKFLGPRCMLIEYGSGSSLKTRILLEAMTDPVAYVPIDISREHLLQSAQSLDRRHPELETLPVCADFTEAFTLPLSRRPAARRIVYFPGSTIGNLHPPEVVAFLDRIGTQCQREGALLIGVDLSKSRDILEAAYDDAAGITAAFNGNLLTRMNRELEADFDLERFAHRAVWDEARSRVEMHLVSDGAQTVTIAGERFDFQPGEWIHTESSYKYGREHFAALAERGNLEIRQVWTDESSLFSVQYLTPR